MATDAGVCGGGGREAGRMVGRGTVGGGGRVQGLRWELGWCVECVWGGRDFGGEGGYGQLWPIPSLAIPTLARFGQNQIWPNELWPNQHFGPN